MAYDGTKFRWVHRRVHTANVVFGEVLYEPGGSCGPRVQRDYELILIHSGEGHVTLNRTAHSMKSGTVSLFLPGNHDYFEYAPNAETHHSWCTIRSRFMPGNLRKKLRRPVVSLPASGLVRSLFEGALKLKPTPRQPLDALITHLALSVFAEFLRISAGDGNESVEDPAVNAFLGHVRDHFAERDCLRAARVVSGVSRNTLLYKFHQAMQTTPAKYLWKVRVERGVSMLAETGKTVAEISYLCGFQNPFHFSRLLKRQTGRSPVEVRRHAWKQGG